MTDRQRLSGHSMSGQASAGVEHGMRLATLLLMSFVLHVLLLAVPVGGGAGQAMRQTPAASLTRALQVVFPTQPHDSARSPDSLNEETSSVEAASHSSVNPNTASPVAHEQAGIAPPYYPVASLSRLPEALSDFGPQAHDTPEGRASGRAEMRLWIDAAGKVERVDLLSTNLPDILARSAQEALRQMHFRPGEIAGRPVASWSDIVIEYDEIPGR